MVKKIYTIILSFFLMFLLFACKGDKVLKLYNWGEYLDSNLKDKFYKETGIKVKEITFDSNEIALTSIKSGNNYDLVIPSDYAIDHLKNSIIDNKSLIQKIDWSRIKYNRYELLSNNLKEILNDFKETKKYDPLDFCVPYFWGSFGLLYNSNKISKEFLDEKQWDILKTETAKNRDGDFNSIKVAIYDSASDLFTVALKQNNKSIRNASKDDINIAYKWLESIPKKNRNFITDEIFDDIPNHTYDVVPAYSGDASYIIEQIRSEEFSDFVNEEFRYYVPKNGSNVWFDGFVIPNESNLDLAYEFINFMLKDENAYQNASECGYASSVNNSLKKQIEEDYENELDQIKHIIGYNKSINDEIQIYKDDIKKYLEYKWTVFRCG